jgi:hypothetical protein
MTGENQRAKVQASRVLMDALADPTSFEERDFRAKIAREIDAEAAAASAKIEELVLRVVVGIVRDELEHLPGWVVTLAGNLDADVQARIHELREEREQLATELGKVKLEREGFAA